MTRNDQKKDEHLLMDTLHASHRLFMVFLVMETIVCNFLENFLSLHPELW